MFRMTAATWKPTSARTDNFIANGTTFPPVGLFRRRRSPCRTCPASTTRRDWKDIPIRSRSGSSSAVASCSAIPSSSFTGKPGKPFTDRGGEGDFARGVEARTSLPRPFDHSTTGAIPLNLPPTRFRGKIWISVAQAIFLGTLGLFSVIAGPLFLFGDFRDARGQPAKDAGVALTLMSIPFLLGFVLAVFHVVVHRRPIISICREGLQIGMTGSSAFDGISLLPGIIHTTLLVITGQGFKQQTLRVPWQSLHSVEISGMRMAQKVTIVGGMRKLTRHDTAATSSVKQELVPHEVMFHEVVFKTPLDRIVTTINTFRENPEARVALESWDD